MYLKQSFEEFLSGSVNLDDTRIKRAKSAHTIMREKLSTIEDLAPFIVGTYLQGSYALHTAIRPSHDDAEYDVDVVMALNTDKIDEKDSILDWLYGLIDSISIYSGKVEIRERCLRIQYQSDDQRFHLDLLPAHQPEINDDPFEIPPDWIESNPKGYVQWLNGIRSDHCARVRHIVRLLKYWRNHQFSSGSVAPNSMILTTLIGMMAPSDKQYKSLDDALVKTMTSLDKWLQDLQDGEEVIVCNPALESENLARNWEWSDVEEFREVFHEATLLAKEAIKCKDEAKTIAMWRNSKLFGERFPKKVRGLNEEAKSVSAALAAGILGVQRSGEVQTAKAKGSYSVPDNRGFFGDHKSHE